MNHQPTDFTAARAGARRVLGLPFPVSRRTDPVSVRPGVRVIVRYRLHSGATQAETPAPHGPSVTDVIGPLLSIDPLIVRPQSGARSTAAGTLTGAQASPDPVEIAHEDVVVLKTLSAKPVRNSDIRAVEQASAAAFPGIDNRMISGWLARAGDGITERSNSAVPLGPTAGTQPVPLDEIRQFYAAHGLPVQLMLPDRIGRTGENIPGERGPEIIVMTRSLCDPDLPLPEVPAPTLDAKIELSITSEPDEDWFRLYHFRGEPLPRHALELLSNRIDGELGFARLHVDGRLAAITRGTITRGGHHHWLGFSAVEVAPEYRRHGLGTYLGAQMLHWGQLHGAEHAYLDVIETNLAGRAMYHNLGFSEHHRHRSLTVPALR